jgi:type VI secretion system protein VasD
MNRAHWLLSLRWRRRAAFCAIAAPAFFAGVGPAVPAQPDTPLAPRRVEATAAGATPLELTIVGGPDLNPNLQGRASPVVVRIFELKSAGAFEAADYSGLFERPAEALKDDLVAQEEFVLRPGDIQHRDRTAAPGVRLLGVAAAYRRLDLSAWRLAIPVKPGTRNLLLIDVGADKIRLATVDSGPP